MNTDILELKLKKYCHSAVIDIKMNAIKGFDAELSDALMSFLETEKYPDISVNGWTLERIMEKTHENIIEAFIYMDMMKKNPDYAECFGYLGFRRK